MLTIMLDWPDKALSPNARVHRMARANTVAYHREMAWAKAHDYHHPGMTRVNVYVTFYPPDHRRRDLDNCYAMCKAYQDGIFQALGLDDSRIEMVELRFGRERDGRVRFCIEPVEEGE